MRSVASVAKKEESVTMSVDEAMMMMNDDEAETMMMINDDEAEMKLDNDEEKTMMTAWLKEELIDGAEIGLRYKADWNSLPAIPRRRVPVENQWKQRNLFVSGGIPWITLCDIYEEGTNFAFRYGFKGEVWSARILQGFY